MNIGGYTDSYTLYNELYDSYCREISYHKCRAKANQERITALEEENKQLKKELKATKLKSGNQIVRLHNKLYNLPDLKNKIK